MKMTQEKEGLFKSLAHPYAVMKSQEKDTLSQDKSASPELLSLIKAAAKSLDAFGSLWETIKKKGHDEGFTEPELQDMLRPMLSEQMGMSKDKVYYIFHKEQKALANKKAYDRVRINRQIVQKKDPEDLAEMEAIAGKYDSGPLAPPVQQEEEEDREKALLRDEVDQLRDAIKKLQQFPKASELQAVTVAAKVEQPKQEEDDINTVVLKERIVLIEKDLTKARDLLMRQLMQLKGRGWHIVELSARYIS